MKLFDSSKNETTTLNIVPQEERKSWLDVSLIQAGVYICVSSLLLGGLLISAMPFRDAIIAGTLGYLISVIITAIIGIAGEDLGVPTCIVTMSCFGKNGARIIISTIFALAMIGWFSIQNAVCGQAFSTLIYQMGFNIPMWVSITIWGIVMLTTAVSGINGLKILNQLAVPALAIIMTVASFIAVKQFGTAALSESTEQTMSIIDGIVMTVSFISVGMTCAPDFTRYQKSRGGVVTSSFLGIMLPGVILLVMGAVLTKIAGENDLSLVLASIGMPILGAIILILATWTTNTTNAYSAGINFVMLFKLRDDKRAITTMIAGVIGTVIAALGFYGFFENFVNGLGTVFMPAGGVIVADYWLIRKGDSKLWGYSDGFNFAGIISWIVGVVVTMNISHGMSLFIGFFASIALYYVLYKVLPNKNEKPMSEDIMNTMEG